MSAMTWLRAAVACLSAALPLLVAFWLFRRIRRTRPVSGRAVVGTGVAGALAAAIAWRVELGFLSWAGMELRTAQNAIGAALTLLLLFGPLEEALKLAVVWPSYVRRRLVSGRVGVLFAVAGAGGFASLEMLLAYWVDGARQWIDLLRGFIALPAHLFFAALWGYTLGRGYRARLPWVVSAVALLHGGYDYVVFGRGPALLVVVVPVVLMMIVGTWMLLREDSGTIASSGRLSLFEPPSVRTVREAMRTTGQPLMLHWIAFGALVTLGVTLSFLALAVYVGHRYGVDFAQVDESDLLATVPLSLLGAALLAAFPVSGYLVARASGARSVLEPAWSTGAAILLTLGMFSMTEPMALVVAASVAPVGFALGCVGAWFGVDRKT